MWRYPGEIAVMSDSGLIPIDPPPNRSILNVMYLLKVVVR
jgi:hypothetical protein